MFGLVVTYFASEEASGNILSMLGIDWKLLSFQIIAFGLLVFILAKWIFPVFFKIIDKRQAAIDAGNKAAVEAARHAEKAQDEIKKMLTEARADAKEIVATAKEEAAALASESEKRSKTQAERIVQTAHDELTKEVAAAKRTLHNETIDLIATATTKVVGSSIGDKTDRQVIERALKESQ